MVKDVNKMVMDFLRKRDEFRERVLQACVDCGYKDLTIREWVPAPSGNENYPTEVRSGQTVIAKMWIDGLQLNAGGWLRDDAHIIRFRAKACMPDIAERLAESVRAAVDAIPKP